MESKQCNMPPMSLSSHLNDPQSPVYGFMRERFPNIRSFVRETNKEIKEATTIRPEGKVDWGTIGMAIDYRLRYYFDVPSSKNLVAWKGSQLVAGKAFHASPEELSDPKRLSELMRRKEGGEWDGAPKVVAEFFVDLENILSQLSPQRRRLEREHEEILARYCVGLALFEQVLRLGLISPGSLLIFPQPVGTASELLARVPQAWVDDLCALSWAFHEDHEELLARPVVLNPTFDGSPDVGGADADLIVDGCLLDIKTRVEPRLRGDDLYQLLGYTLLDYSDRYGIGEAGIYFTRQQRMLRWPLGDLIGNLSGEDVPSLHELRDQLRSIVQVS